MAKVTFIVFFLILSAIAMPVFAAEAPAPTPEVVPECKAKWSFVITTNVRSEYVDPYGITNTSHPVVQDEVTITSPSGVYVDLWHSHQLARPGVLSYNNGDEIDVSLGWSGTLWDKKPYSIDVDLGITYEDYVGLGSTSGDILLPYLELGHEFDLGKVSIEPFVRFEYAFPVNGNENGNLNGSFLFTGLKVNVDLSDKWSINEKLDMETDDGAFGYKPGGVVIDSTSTVSYKATDTLTLDVEARITKSLNDAQEKGSAAVFSVGATWSF